MKGSRRWIVFDLEDPDFIRLDTEQEAREIAKKWLQCYRDDAEKDGGWSEAIDNVVGIAEIKVTTVEVRHETREEYEARGEEWPWDEDEICDYGLVDVKQPPDRPTVVCLCGSTRFFQEFQEANLRETLAGRIVLSIGCNMKTDAEHFGRLSQDQRDTTKAKLDELHLRKIDLADEVLILNVGGYIGESTARELAYAKEHGKRIRSLVPIESNLRTPAVSKGLKEL